VYCFWDRQSYSGVEISWKVLSIVGCGRMGQVVASSATAMGIGYHPIISAQEGEKALACRSSTIIPSSLLKRENKPASRKLLS
jgi:phosphoglycerate dehydrogenase-like enzyme